MKFAINFLNHNNRKILIKSGDMIISYTGLKEDVYKATDPQVISGKMKVGEPKIRYGLVLKIHSENNIDVIFASNADGDKFSVMNKKGNIIYKFRGRSIRYIDPQKPNTILEKCSANYQLEDPELVLDEILASSYYAKFLKRKRNNQLKKLKQNDFEWEM